MPATGNKRDPVATRQRILECAGKLLAQGEGALEMAWVAKAAGVSAGLAYHHFGSKRACWWRWSTTSTTAWRRPH